MKEELMENSDGVTVVINAPTESPKFYMTLGGWGYGSAGSDL